MTIRKATLSDIEHLAKLFDRYRVFYRRQTDLPGATIFLTERIKNKESEIFVSENDEKELVGFVQLYPLFSSTNMQRLWLLNDLFVDENYRGQGVSILLIEKSKTFCKETDAYGLILETAKTNDVGNKLYLKTGFSLDKDHNYYSWDHK